MGLPAPLIGCGPGRTPGSDTVVVCARTPFTFAESSKAAATRQHEKALKMRFCLAPFILRTFILFSFLGFLVKVVAEAFLQVRGYGRGAYKPAGTRNAESKNCELDLRDRKSVV